MHCDWAFCYNCLVHVGGGSCSLVVEGSNGSPRFHLFTTINTKGRDRSSLKINTSDVWHVHCVLWYVYLYVLDTQACCSRQDI
jgi:hypothetical protein